eukprot:TRINITY_DN21197_c0_g1_i1.p2 TRINITY_DN21197_c0_g1~~TRINITY_DN21197_c0_g1_i1.p2  ORF type:complete len:103 (+),score=2.13 TRINITY_DN21197_c0_g1_i1:86-394(+)
MKIISIHLGFKINGFSCLSRFIDRLKNLSYYESLLWFNDRLFVFNNRFKPHPSFAICFIFSTAAVEGYSTCIQINLRFVQPASLLTIDSQTILHISTAFGTT